MTKTTEGRVTAVATTHDKDMESMLAVRAGRIQDPVGLFTELPARKNLK